MFRQQLIGVLQNDFSQNSHEGSTAQKMKFSIKDFLVKVTKSAGTYGFGHI